MNDIPGARWWKFDFHTHTPASLDTPWAKLAGDEEPLTPETWLFKYMDAGIDAVVITDHNSGAWIDCLKEAYARMEEADGEGFRPLVIFPGVEISVSGGFHLLAILDTDKGSSEIDSLLGAVGYEATKGDSDGVTTKGPEEVLGAIEKAGGIAIPAHINDDKGLLATDSEGRLRIDPTTVKQVLSHPGVCALECTHDGFEAHEFVKKQYAPFSLVIGSDTHNFRSETKFPGAAFTWAKLHYPNLSSLRLALLDGNNSGLVRSCCAPPEFNPNQNPELWIEALEVKNAALMGNGQTAKYPFSPWLNAIIGGRGSGKSTLVHFIRLTGRRENDLDRLPADSRPRKSFISFADENGGLLNESQATLIYCKGEERYRLNWKRSDRGTTVESWHSDIEDWVAEDSQNVRERFPVTIFSQEQVATLAESPQAILQRIDEAIDHQAWQNRWQQELEKFLQLRSEVRNLRNRSSNKDRLLGQLKDLTKKLEVFEKSEHAQVLKTARRFQRQADEFNSLKDRHLEMSKELKQFAEDFLLYDLSDDLYDPSRTEEAPLAEVEKELRSSVENTRDKLLRLAKKLKITNRDALKAVNNSEWKKRRELAKRSHDRLVEELKSKGVENPDEYSALLQQRQGIARELSKVKAVEEEIAHNERKAASSLENLAELRKELTTARERFLEENIAGNNYVRISVVPFGKWSDRHEAEQSLRRVLGCEDRGFKSSILSDDGDVGFIADLYPKSKEETTQEKEKRLAQWKGVVAAYLDDRETDLDFYKPFVNFLKNTHENNPEVFDRLAAWWPEDSLEVRYSKTGDGRNFSSLEDGSAGEKAAALLAFFLAYGDSPLVIDQPENDLDNHLITDLVVKQLQENKARRQIIVVSHNPNIVVNADSEMVHAMKYVSGQCRPVAQGALQEETVRNEVCEVMEGGELALRKRYRRLTTPQ